MRLPGWIAYSIPKDTGHLYVRVWHPGFWWAVWQEISIEPRWLKPALWLYIMVRLIYGSR